MKVVFACAGTGGHINPAIAIAKYMKKKDKNFKALFIGTFDGLENSLVSEAGFDIVHIRTGKLRRSLTIKNFSEMYRAFLGTFDAKKVLKEFKPDAVIGTGGYICMPVCKAAKSLKIPYFLHESNAFPGICVKLLSKNASKVFIGFKDAKARLKNRENIVFSGTPTKFNKDEYDKLSKKECKKSFNLPQDKKILLVTGGSQGALKFTNIIFEYLEKYRNENLLIILVAGNKNYEYAMQKKAELENKISLKLDSYIRVEKFIFDMDKMYKAADICMTRSGAMTITELALADKKAILVPYPYAAENHQLYNAKVIQNAGLGIIIEESNLNIETLNTGLEKIYNLDNTNIKTDNIYVKDVYEIIYKNILDVIKK